MNRYQAVVEIVKSVPERWRPWLAALALIVLAVPFIGGTIGAIKGAQVALRSISGPTS